MKKKILERQLKEERLKCNLLTHALTDALYENATLKEECDGIAYIPDIDEVIFNGPATIVKWEDGTKTVSKARGGDEFDPLFGLMACAVRKVTRNRDHMVDVCEEQLRSIAEAVEEFGDLTAYYTFFAIMVDALGAVIDGKDKWYDQLCRPSDPKRPEEQEPSTTVGNINVIVTDSFESLNKRVNELERKHEQTRQKVRELIDEGEL